MTLRFRVYRNNGLLMADVPVEKCQLNYGLGKSGEWSTAIPSTLDAANEITRGNLVEIFYQGTLLMSGRVQGHNIKFDDVSIIDLKGRDLIDDLYDHPAYDLAVFKNKSFILSLAELLDQAGWRVGDISTLTGADTHKVTVDLRAEPRLLPQIAKLISFAPKVVYRYGGLVDGKHTLDVGYFGEESGLSFYSPPDDPDILNTNDGLIANTDVVGFIDKFSFQVVSDEIVYGGMPIGGAVLDSAGIARVISLYDALQNDLTLTQHSQFPVVEQIAVNRYFCFDSVRCPYPGGENHVKGSGTAGVWSVGNPSASVGRSHQIAIWIYPTPGRLTEISIDTAAGTLGTITDPLSWWVCSAGAFPTPGSVLASGRVNDGLWVASSRLKIEVPFDQQITFEPGQEYVFIFGYDKPGGFAINTYRSMLAHPTNPQLAIRRSQSVDNGATWANYTTNVPRIRVKTEPVNPPRGAITRDRANEIAPEKTETSATLDDTKAAGAQLWAWWTGYLQDHEEERIDYSLAVLGDVRIPSVGDSVYVHGSAEGATIDPFTGDSSARSILVSDDLRVDSIRISIDGDKREMEFGLTKGNGLTNQDTFVEMLDAAERKSAFQLIQGTAIPGIVTYALAETTQNVLAAAPDATMSDGRAAKLVTISAPSAPTAFYNNVDFACTPYGTSPRGDVDVEIVSRHAPVLSAFGKILSWTDAQVRVCVRGGWIATDTATLYLKYFWI